MERRSTQTHGLQSRRMHRVRLSARLGLWLSLWLLICLSLGLPARAETPLSLQDALAQAYEINPEIHAAQSRASAEQSQISVARSLANPRFGLMRENKMTPSQEEMGPMNSWSISQEILFPPKYFLMGDAQKATAEAATHELGQTRLEVRQKVISSYVQLHAAREILSLLTAQRESLREIARIAEARRATGAAPQQDEMKAHVEQTKLENEVLIQEQEVERAAAELNALLKRPAFAEVLLNATDFKAPSLQKSTKEIEHLALENSQSLASRRSMLKEAEKMRTLAQMSYAPDFMVSFRKPFSNAPSDAYAIGVEMSLPLWFFSRQTSEVSAASARASAAQSELETTTHSTQAQVRTLAAKAERFEKMIRIYNSALIPQATSSLNSSRAAYTAGRAGFLELLDAERSLYEVRIAYYKALSMYVESLTQLETVTGVSLSTLPFGVSL